jgi:hypothetical protein
VKNPFLRLEHRGLGYAGLVSSVRAFTNPVGFLCWGFLA